MQESPDDPILGCLLPRLNEARGQQASLLHLTEQRIHVLAPREGTGKNVCRRHGILDRKIDADPADRRHGMRSVSDREQAWLVPSHQPVELDGEKVQIGDFIQLGEIKIGRSGRSDFRTDRFDSTRLLSLGSAFRDQERALPIVSAVDHHEQASALHVPA